METPFIATQTQSASTEVLEQVAPYIQARKYTEIFEILRSALSRDPNNANLLNARGCVFAAMGQHHDALKWYRDAVELDPSAAGIWNNLGTAFMQLKYFQAAVSCHQRAIQLSASEAFMHQNLGLCLAETGHHGEAVLAFSRAIALQSDFHIARWDRARSLLFLGNYQQAWTDYEVRLVTGQVPQRHKAGKKWAGESYAGMRLLILVEQGFGDTLWALRYLPTVKALGGELIIECRVELFSLIESLGIADHLIIAGQPLPETDLYCYVCSLPGLFTRALSSLPARPYLSASRDRVEKIKLKIEKTKNRLNVGIIWSGSVTFGKNNDRALPLRRLLQAVDLPGVQLYSLQKGPPEVELSEHSQGRGIINLASELNDFADTAAAVSELDLVIMTDSAVAHLAGALGKPVWILLGHSAHWLWLLDRADSPWYSSVRLFRPRVEGDWHYVIDNVAVELMKLTKI